MDERRGGSGPNIRPRAPVVRINAVPRECWGGGAVGQDGESSAELFDRALTSRAREALSAQGIPVNEEALQAAKSRLLVEFAGRQLKARGETS